MRKVNKAKALEDRRVENIWNLSCEVDLAVNLLHIVLQKTDQNKILSEDQQWIMFAVAYSTLIATFARYGTPATLFDLAHFPAYTSPSERNLLQQWDQTIHRWHGAKNNIMVNRLKIFALQLSRRGVAAWYRALFQWWAFAQEPRIVTTTGHLVPIEEDFSVQLQSGFVKLGDTIFTGEFWHKFSWEEVWTMEQASPIFDRDALVRFDAATIPVHISSDDYDAS